MKYSHRDPVTERFKNPLKIYLLIQKKVVNDCSHVEQ